MDWMGFEPTTSAMPDTFYCRTAIERETRTVQILPVHYLVGFKTSSNVHGYEAKNTVSKHIKSFQSFDRFSLKRNQSEVFLPYSCFAVLLEKERKTLR
jgi:hypothetical protein